MEKKFTHEEMMEKAWRFIYDMEITDEKEKLTDTGYLVKDVYQVRDAFYADLESDHDFDGEDMEGFISRHGIRLAPVFEPAGKWWNGGQEQIKKDGITYALYGWNGESYTDSWEVVDGTEPAGKYDIRPIYQQVGEDEFEIIDYEIIRER